MGRIYQRKPGGVYHGEWYDEHNRRQRQSLKTRDTAVARKRLRAAELAAADRAAHGPQAGLVEAIGWVLTPDRPRATLRSYEQKARHLVRLFGDVQLRELGRGACKEYVATRLAEGAASSTVHKELVVLRLALAEARDRDMWAGDVRAIVPTVKSDYKPRTRWLSSDELEALLPELPPERQLWVMLACYTGANYSEVERIAPSDIVGGRIHIRGTKRNARDRWIPIAAPLKPWLRGARLPVEHWGNSQRDLAAACVRAGIGCDPGCPDHCRIRHQHRRRCSASHAHRWPPTSNDLRRTFASWLVQEGVDTLTVAKLMGHSTTRMVELVYAQLHADNYKDAIARLPGARKLRSV